MKHEHPVVFDRVSYTWEGAREAIFQDFSIELPAGITSLVGQNGTGKSTLLLLAGGVLPPEEGTVTINGIDSRDLRDETERHRQVSFLYQNMEFETAEPIARLLERVFEQGFLRNRSTDFIDELVEVFELEKCLDRKTQEVSKGELQRTILAFSLLYGSPLLMMDEPVFAMEDYQKERAFEYLTDYAGRHGISIYYSIHELDLSRRYSQYILLFKKLGEPELGTTEEMFVREKIEEAYQVPYSMLRHRERVYRKLLRQQARQFRQGPDAGGVTGGGVTGGAGG